MKKRFYVCYVLALLLCFVFLAGCGKDEGESREDKDRTEAEAPQEGVMEYQDIRSDSKEAFNMDGILGRMLGMQFYQGEPAMIWAIRNNGLADIYLYREDGSREMLLEGMPEDYYFANWFLDIEGGFYRWNNVDSLVKMDKDGKELYKVPLEDIGTNMIEDLRQLADGRLLITYLAQGGGSSYVLSEVNPDTGEVSRVSTARLDGTGRVAAGEDGLLYLDASGVSVIDMENGSKERLLSFTGTSYQLKENYQNSIEDFRVLEDGGVELLRYRWGEDGEKAYLSEVLQLSEETTQKVVLSMRCWNVTGHTFGIYAWLKNQLDRFNRQSDSYVVVLDECPDGTELEDFSRRTSIEMTAGKGPDLLFGDVLGDYAYGAIQKGLLADLAPYMEASGIKEEDYFPLAFGGWREGDGVYSVSLSVELDLWRIRKGVLEGGSVPDGEALADALLAWPEDAVLSDMFDSGKALRYLLEGSEDFWGMLDWEAGTCDFSGASFAKMLEAAKRYGSDGLTEKPEMIEPRSCDILTFDTAEDQEAEGMETAGVLFDDGFHPAMWNHVYHRMMAINANSSHVEGAWEFISFLLGEEVQRTFQGGPNDSGYGIPVHRGAFEEYVKKQIAFDTSLKLVRSSYIRYVEESGEFIEKYPRSYKSLTDEKVAEYRAMLEDARPLPIRTVPLLDIIAEEAEYYFNGTKNIEEVSAVIQNRVQLYMDENR